MGDAAATRPRTASEYLAFEEASPLRHEFVRGEVFAMAGTTDAHNEVTQNLAALLRAHLRGGPCRAYVIEVQLRVELADAYFYPDLFVTCDPRDRDDPRVKRYAKLVVEVLSESTAAYDRGDKFDDYRRLESLREYVLVDSRARRAMVYRRSDEAARWEFEPVPADGSLLLASIALRVPLAALYEDTSVPSPVTPR